MADKSTNTASGNTTRFIKVVHQNQTHRVGLYSGLCPLELSKLLTAVFSLNADGFSSSSSSAVCGFQDERTGTVLPISLACAQPELLSQPVYRLLLTDSESFFIPPTPPTPSSTAAASASSAMSSRGTAVQLLPPPVPASSSNRDEQEEEEEDGDDADGEEEEAVEEDEYDRQLQQRMQTFLAMLMEEGLVTDAEANVLNNMIQAKSRILGAGFRVAQYRKNAEMLAAFWKATAAASLMEPNLKVLLLHQEQMLEILSLLYTTEHLTKLQHVNLEYLVLLQHESVSDLYEQFRRSGDLQQFCLNLASLGNAAERLIRETNAEEQGGANDEDQCGKQSGSKTFEEVIESLQQQSGLQAQLANWLIQDFKAGDEYLTAAYDIYKADKNEVEFVDSLLRILKVKIDGLRKAHEQQKRKAESEGDEKKAPLSRDGASQTKKDEEESSQEAGDEGVPQGFMLVIVNAVRHNVLTTEQGASLCDLYVKGNEFVRAAWEVFVLERDVSDFIDTLLRVLIKEGKLRCRSEASTSTKSTAAAAATSPQSSPSNIGITRKAILAQSLEVMVARSMIDLKGFRTLVALLDNGSEILQAAIDAFVVDHDVEELLDTLRLIAAHATSDQAAELLTSCRDDKIIEGKTEIKARGKGMPDQDECESDEEEEEEDMSCASDKAAKCSAASVASFSTEGDRSIYREGATIAGGSGGLASGRETPANTSSNSKEEGGGSELTIADKEELIIMLAAAGAIDEDECRTLIQLANARDWLLAGHFKLFVKTKDIRRFQRQLKMLVRSTAVLGGMEEGGDKDQANDQREEEEDEEEEEEEEEEEDQEEEEEEGGNSSPDSREQDPTAEFDDLFYQLVQDMNPSSLETAALRLCIARDDEHLKSALDSYRRHGDTNEIKEALKQVARRTIVEMSRNLPVNEEGGREEGGGGVASSTAGCMVNEDRYQQKIESLTDDNSTETMNGGNKSVAVGGMKQNVYKQDSPSFLASSLEKKLVLSEEEKRVLGLMPVGGFM